MTLPKTATIFFASIAACATLPAMAGSTSESTVRTVDVSIAGYDLTDPADARTVFSKIQRAAKRVCNNPNGDRSVRDRADSIACQSNAIAEAVAKLDMPELTEVMSKGQTS